MDSIDIVDAFIGEAQKWKIYSDKNIIKNEDLQLIQGSWVCCGQQSEKVEKPSDRALFIIIITVQASFPISPPAQIKLSLSNTKAAPSLVPRKDDWQPSADCIITSTCFCTFWNWPVKAFLPHPDTQHLQLDNYKYKEVIRLSPNYL